MGITHYSFSSPYAFLMSVLWFSVFILLGLWMRKLKFPLRFSVAPLLGLLGLSLFRMMFIIEVPGSMIIRSTVVLPVAVNFLGVEIAPYKVFGLSVNILNIALSTWIFVAAFLFTRYLIKYIKNYRTLMALAFSRDREAEFLLAEIIAPKKLPKRTH